MSDLHICQPREISVGDLSAAIVAIEMYLHPREWFGCFAAITCIEQFKSLGFIFEIYEDEQL